MTISISDIRPFSDARAAFSKVVEDCLSGREIIVTKNGKPAVAVINVQQLEWYHQLEQEAEKLVRLVNGEDTEGSEKQGSDALRQQYFSAFSDFLKNANGADSATLASTPNI